MAYIMQITRPFVLCSVVTADRHAIAIYNTEWTSETELNINLSPWPSFDLTTPVVDFPWPVVIHRLVTVGKSINCKC